MNDQKLLNEIRKKPKTDFHNHALLGGRFSELKKATGLDLLPPPKTMSSLREMNQYLARSIIPNITPNFSVLPSDVPFSRQSKTGFSFYK